MMPAEQHLDLMVPFRFIYCILGALLFFKSNAPESARGVKTPIALSALLCRVKIFTTSYISEPRSLPPPSYFDIFARPARVRFQRFPALKRAHVVEPCSFTTTRGMPRCSPGSPAPILDWTKTYRARYYPSTQIMARLNYA